MYRTDLWTLWEKARVGCFERTACILSIVKQITSPGGMHETSAQAWCTGNTQRNWVEREVGGGSGWGIHVNPWLIHVNVWQNPLQYCEVISLQLIKINGKKKVPRKVHCPPPVRCRLLLPLPWGAFSSENFPLLWPLCSIQISQFPPKLCCFNFH